jgi:hypothetical protein
VLAAAPAHTAGEAMKLEVLPDPESVARRGAGLIAAAARSCVS